MHLFKKQSKKSSIKTETMVLNLEDVKNAKIDAHFFVSIKLHSFHKTSTKTFWYYFQEDVS